MNPFLLGNQTSTKSGFRKGRNTVSGNRYVSKESIRIRNRRMKDWVHKSARRKDSFGAVSRKENLVCALLNVDGMTDSSFADVKEVLSSKRPDVCLLLETKRRFEEEESCIDVLGYDVTEYRRSDIAGDKGGGGLAIYTRKADGLVFKDFDPDLPDQALAFVRNERAWKTVETSNGKTAICTVYAGFQSHDDMNADWNNSLYSVLRMEVASLRRDGFRVVLLGDFNGHVGDNPATGGIVGNKTDINRNGRRFLDFLHDTNCVHVNGYQNLATGIWTRQRAGVSSVIDYGVIAQEHLKSVKSMFIDDQGLHGGGSDHNWIFLDLDDSFVKKIRVSNLPIKRASWNLTPNQDWSGFQDMLNILVDETDKTLDATDLSKRVADILVKAGAEKIGFRSKSVKKSMIATMLPRDLVAELQLKRQMEKDWKSKSTLFSSTPVAQRTEEMQDSLLRAEKAFQEQRSSVEKSFFIFRGNDRAKVLKKCSGNSQEARKYFWSYVNKKHLQSSEIDAVLTEDGVLHCSPEDVIHEVEGHLVRLYSGDLDPIPPDVPANDHGYASNLCPPFTTSDPSCDHPYSSSASPRLPTSDGSGSLETDPDGWMNRDFILSDIVQAVKTLKCNKAVGIDHIPNEFLINGGTKFWNLLTLLYNKVKKSGVFPPGWNKGRVTLVHKKGSKEKLGNYRPLTVIVSLSGLYSRLLNERLTRAVETHGLLGEIQNGFRKGRMGADNSFILNTILWKQKALKKKVHMAFIDLVKAYDMVDRNILWEKMSGFGFDGEFLSSLKSIYTGDSVQAEVNGVSTRPVYLRRGLRQGCSLSPMLFALYIADMGQAISLSSEGFRVGNVVVSGLLFADDLLLLAHDPGGLLQLLSLVKRHADLLRMEINTGSDKSEVVSPNGAEGDMWQVLDNNGGAILSLRQVTRYKYLGNTTMTSMYKIGQEKQKQCVAKAIKYKGSCVYMSRNGPDVVDMVSATWSNIAIPSIMYGTEMIPFSETNIKELEKAQNQVAKYALGVPIGTPGVCAQIELGFEPVRQVLYQNQLKFYSRLLKMDSSRWVKQAFLDHQTSAWRSPYISYITNIRSKLGLYEMPMTVGRLLKFIRGYFVNITNDALASLSLSWLPPIKSFTRQPYVQEGAASSTLSQFRYNVAPIGNKYPRVGKVSTQYYCPLCPCPVLNTVAHLALFCPYIELVRREQTSLSSFRNICTFKGFSEAYMFQLIINGMDWNENPVVSGDFLRTGHELKLLMDCWLNKW